MFSNRALKKFRIRLSGFLGSYWLLIGGVLLLLSVLINGFVGNKLQKVDRKHIEQEIQSYISDFDKLAATWFMSPTKERFVENLWKDMNERGFAARFCEKGVTLHLFRRDSLIFWNTDDMAGIGELLDHYTDETKLDTVGNSIVVIHGRHIGQFKAVMTIRIKRHYPYENRYLQNTFNVSLFKGQGFELYDQRTAGTIAIRGPESEELFYLKKKPDPHGCFWASFLGWLGIFVIIIGFQQNMVVRCTARNALQNILTTAAVIIVIRCATYLMHFPTRTGVLFEPLRLSGGLPSFSLGNLLIDSTISMIMVSYVSRVRHRLRKQIYHVLKTWQKYMVKSAYLVVYILFTLFSHYVLCILIFESSVEFGLHDLLHINLLTLVGYSIILIAVAIRIILLYLGFDIFKSSQQNCIAIIINILLLLAILPLNKLFYNTGFVLLLSQIVISVLLYFFKGKRSHKIYVLLLSILAVYLTVTIFYGHQKRKWDNQYAILVRLSQNSDPVTQEKLKNFFYNFNFNAPDEQLKAEISLKLGPQLADYDLTFAVDSVFYNHPSKANQDTIHDLERMIERQGRRIGTYRTPVYAIQDESGLLRYIIKNQYSPLYISVAASRNVRDFVYKYLMNTREQDQYSFYDYSYARYYRNYLVESRGSYSYEQYIVDQPPTEGKPRIEYSGEYRHFMFVSSGGNTLIVSITQIAFHNICSLFVYIFLILLVGEFLVLMMLGYPYSFKIVKNSISFKIRIILISVISLSMAIIIWFVLSYYLKRVKERILNNMIYQTETIRNSYMNRHGKNDLSTETARRWASSIHNIFDVDIIMYDSTGCLMTITDPSLKEDRIIGDKISPLPYYNLKNKWMKTMVIDTDVGNLHFKLVFVPIVQGATGQTIGYIGVPFLKNESRNYQMGYSLIINVLNIFAFVMFVAIILSIILYNGISKPISALSQSIRNINQKKKVHFSQHARTDEIGTLIVQYNNMIDELEENYRRISRIERETAWKQMAQQVAHEIKNPLTPMKLKIQMVKRLKANNDPSWEEQIDGLFVTLLEQIDLLSVISREFSLIGKIDSKPPEQVDVNEMLVKLRQFYSDNPTAKVTYENHTSSRSFISVDYDSVWRALVNICSNAIMAVGNRTDGLIRISLEREGTNVVISISDNGIGMTKAGKEKLFQYGFSTKKSGSGLGLIITRQIIESYKGHIRYESEYGVGTTFYITFPIDHIELF